MYYMKNILFNSVTDYLPMDGLCVLYIYINPLDFQLLQDRVGAFALYTPKEILQRTLESIALPDDPERTLFDEQLVLSEQENNKSNHQRTLDEKKSAHANKVRELEGMHAEVQRIRARQEAQKQLDLYEVKLVIEQAREGKARVLEKQRLVDEANNALLEAEKIIQPLEAKVRDLSRKQETRKRTSEAANNSLKTVEKSIRDGTSDIENLENAIEFAKRELAYVDTEHQNLVNKLRDAEVKVKKIDEKLQVAVEGLPRAQEKLNTSMLEIDALRAQDTELNTELSDIEGLLNTKHETVTALTNRMTSLLDARQILRMKLSQLAKNRGGTWGQQVTNVLKAMDWLNSQDPKMFKQQVFGPVVSHMKVSILN